MRGIQVDAGRFRQIRESRSLKQRELAILAGVSERTVRNAEAGQRIRLDFLSFLAIALRVEPHDLVEHPDELRVATREERNAEVILEGIAVMTGERDYTAISALMSDRVRFAAPNYEYLPWGGTFVGRGEIKRFIDIVQETVAYERPPEIEEVRSSGNLVIISGREWLYSEQTEKRYSGWWQHIYEYDNGHVARVDTYGDAEISKFYGPGD